MADFTHAPPRPGPHAPPPKVRTAEDLTHQRTGPLGDMVVVPDNHVGHTPPGAVSESDYQRMLAVVGNIESGKSGISIDTSAFMKDDEGNALSLMKDPGAYMQGLAAAGAFREQYMDYMHDLVKTPAGLRLLETLDQSEHKTRIQYGEGGNGALADDTSKAYAAENGTHAAGTGSKVFVDPNELLWEPSPCAKKPEDRFEPWMRDRPRFAFYHEMVHAYHNARGDAAPDGGGYVPCVEGSFEVGNVEFQATGLGPYASNSVSENAIRAQMGAPLRKHYGGARHGTPDPWAQQKDDEEPARRSPAR